MTNFKFKLLNKMTKNSLSSVAAVDRTFADACLLVEVVSGGTLALEAAEGVDAVSPLTQTGQLLALVDVCARDREIINVGVVRLTDRRRCAVDPLLPSRMTVIGLGRKPSPPGHSVLYSAVRRHTVHHEYNQSVLMAESVCSIFDCWLMLVPIFREQSERQL